jgi:hypothetical protein
MQHGRTCAFLKLCADKGFWVDDAALMMMMMMMVAMPQTFLIVFFSV